MSGWFDSHCHVQEEYVEGENGGDVDAVLAQAAAAGVDRLICIGTGETTSAQAVAVARRVQGPDLAAWASIGLHPHEAATGIDDVAALLAREMAVGDGAVVAVGECGLDYFYEHSPRPAQREAFAAQIALAHHYDLALVIHARDAWDDLFTVLASEGVPARTVLHCFTGGPAEAERCLAAGMFVSFSGIITFKNASDVRAAAALCPLDRLLVETDSPFLAPVPFRGRPNEPALLPYVGAVVAEVKGCPVAEVMERSAAAAAAAFATPF
ncbi:MAG TPA: TatD family hydrolase [Acidimicrobiales bacterium]|jgi:TatD DNase family protein|nr:TatD family hydrolase [Acidimicrobiales bacterium]